MKLERALHQEKEDQLRVMEDRLKKQLDREKSMHEIELDRMALKLKSLEEEKVSVTQNARNEGELLLSESRERWKSELAKEKLRAAQEMQKLQDSMEEVKEASRQEAIKSLQESKKTAKILLQ